MEQGGLSQLLNLQYTHTLAPQASRNQQDASLSRSAGAQSFWVLVHPIALPYHHVLAAQGWSSRTCLLAVRVAGHWAVHETPLTRGRTHARAGEQAPTQPRWPVRFTWTPDFCVVGTLCMGTAFPQGQYSASAKSSPLLSLG